MNTRSESDYILSVTQTAIEAFQPVIEAVWAFIERVREALAQLAELAKAHLARCVKVIRVQLVYNRLRAWRTPHTLAVIIAYLWVVKRWPPHTTLAG